MNFFTTQQHDKEKLFGEVAERLKSSSIRIRSIDAARPWGGFFVIEEQDAGRFIQLFFPQLTREDLSISGKLSPKILVVAPGKRLSWQYHHRRAEIWKLVGGQAAVITSETDEQTAIRNLFPGEIIELKQGERHRLVGCSEWGIIAEIWRHTQQNNPSDEEDIVRLEDDFGR